MQRDFAIGFLAVCVLVTGCTGLKLASFPSPGPNDWNTLGGDTGRTRTALTSLTPPLIMEWDQDIAAGIGGGSPITVDSLLLVGTLRGELHAINCRTGKHLGSVSLGDAITGSPVAIGNVVVVGLSSPGESLIAYDLVEGKVCWKRSYGDIEVTPLFYQNKIYIATIYGFFACVEPGTGEKLWEFSLSNNKALKGIRSSPAGAGETVVFGAEDGGIYGMDIEKQQRRWRYQADAAISATPSIRDNVVFISSLAGTVYAIDLETGNLRWEFPAGSPVYAGVTLTRDAAIVSTTGGMLYALAISDGTVRWKRDIGNPVNASPVAAGEHIYVGTLNKELLAVRCADGEVTWKTLLPGRVKSEAAVAHGRIFIPTDDRSIVAFGEETAH